MAFYEDCGPITPVVTQDNYISMINGLCGNMRSDQKEMIMAFAKGTRLPYDFIKELIKLRAERLSDGSWQKTRSGSYRGDFEAALPHAILVNDMDNLIPFFNAVQKYGSLKISDIKALEYSIYAFNDKDDHWASLSKNVNEFNGFNADLYSMMFLFTDFNGIKTPFSLNININRVKAGKLTTARDIRSSLLTYWFPKIDEYFHKGEGKANTAVINDFIQHCRDAIKERRDDTLLSE